MKKFKLILAFFVFVLSYSFTFANLSISPLKHEFSINPWEEVSWIIKVTNWEKTPVTLYTSKEDFIAWDETWTPKFIKPQDKTKDDFSLSNWINIENGNITLAPGETREVRFTTKVPKNWEPGWHYWAIFFSPGAPSWAQVAVVQRLWVLILINVTWDVKIWWELKSFIIGQNNKEDKFEEKNSFETFPINFDIKFENEWNIHIKPTGKITLIDDKWNELKNIWKESIISPAWAFIWEKLVDYIPVNDANGNVLPNSTRKFESVWNWFGYQELREDGTKIVKFKDLSWFYADKQAEKKTYLKFWESINTRTVNKKITAALELSYEWKNKEKKEFKQSKTISVEFEEQYVWVNYWIILGLIIIIAWWVYYIYVIRPKSREKLKRQLLEELSKK